MVEKDVAIRIRRRLGRCGPASGFRYNVSGVSRLLQVHRLLRSIFLSIQFSQSCLALNLILI